MENLECAFSHKDCSTCLATPENNANKADLECRWCPDLGRCSDGTDRNRQDWLKRKCDIHNVSITEMCHITGQVNNFLLAIIASSRRKIAWILLIEWRLQAYPGHGNAAREYPGYGPGHQIAKMSDYGEQIPGPGILVLNRMYPCLMCELF